MPNPRRLRSSRYTPLTSEGRQPEQNKRSVYDYITQKIKMIDQLIKNFNPEHSQENHEKTLETLRKTDNKIQNYYITNREDIKNYIQKYTGANSLAEYYLESIDYIISAAKANDLILNKQPIIADDTFKIEANLIDFKNISSLKQYIFLLGCTKPNDKKNREQTQQIAQILEDNLHEHYSKYLAILHKLTIQHKIKILINCLALDKTSLASTIWAEIQIDAASLAFNKKITLLQYAIAANMNLIVNAIMYSMPYEELELAIQKTDETNQAMLMVIITRKFAADFSHDEAENYKEKKLAYLKQLDEKFFTLSQEKREFIKSNINNCSSFSDYYQREIVDNIIEKINESPETLTPGLINKFESILQSINEKCNHLASRHFTYRTNCSNLQDYIKQITQPDNVAIKFVEESLKSGNDLFSIFHYKPEEKTTITTINNLIQNG